MNSRKNFDRVVQQTKRHYWYRCQEDLLNLNNNDPRQFWRKIGNIGIGNERESAIPNEVVLSDGSVTDNMDIVLGKWQDCFYHLLNQSNNTDSTVAGTCETFNVRNNITCDLLDKQIYFDEVYQIVMIAKFGKSPGIDLNK